jgi:tetratricopeptide (TPR) repeat protein
MRVAATQMSTSLAPEHALAHLYLGIVLGATKRAEQGIAECERALAIDRNLARAHATVGARKVYVGRAEETEAHVRDALRLSPRDSFAFFWLMAAGWAKIHLGRHEEAVDWLRRSIETNRNNPMSHVFFAAALALVGRTGEARAAVKAAVEFNPQLTTARFKAAMVSESDNPVYLAGCERVIDGLRTAGCRRGEATLKAACGSGCVRRTPKLRRQSRLESPDAQPRPAGRHAGHSTGSGEQIALTGLMPEPVPEPQSRNLSASSKWA